MPYRLGGEVTDGWTLSGASIDRAFIRFQLQRVEEEAALTLGHPRSAASGERSASFVLARTPATGADGALAKLVEAIRRNDDGRFWKSVHPWDPRAAFAAPAFLLLLPPPWNGVLLGAMLTALCLWWWRRRASAAGGRWRWSDGALAGAAGLFGGWVGEVGSRTSCQQALAAQDASGLPLMAMWWIHLALTGVLLVAIVAAVVVTEREQFKRKLLATGAAAGMGVVLVLLLLPDLAVTHADTAIDLVLARDLLNGTALSVAGTEVIAGTRHGTLTTDLIALGILLDARPGQILLVIFVGAALAHALLVPLFARHVPLTAAITLPLACLLASLVTTGAWSAVLWTPATIPIASALLLAGAVIYSRRPGPLAALALAGGLGLCIDAHVSAMAVVPIAIALAFLRGGLGQLLLVGLGTAVVLLLRSPGTLACLVWDTTRHLSLPLVAALCAPCLAAIGLRRWMGPRAASLAARWGPGLLAAPWSILVAVAWLAGREEFAPVRNWSVFLPAAGFLVALLLGVACRWSALFGHGAAAGVAFMAGQFLSMEAPGAGQGVVRFMAEAEVLAEHLAERDWTPAAIRDRLHGFQREYLLHAVEAYLPSASEDATPGRERPLSVIGVSTGEFEPNGDDILLETPAEPLLLRPLPQWLGWKDLEICAAGAEMTCGPAPVVEKGFRWMDGEDHLTTSDWENLVAAKWTLRLDVHESRPGAAWLDVLSEPPCGWRLAERQPQHVRRLSDYRARIAPGPRTAVRLETPAGPKCPDQRARYLLPPGIVITGTGDSQLRALLDQARGI